MDKKRRLPDGGQAAEEVKVQPWGGQIKTTMDLMEKKLTGKGSAVGGKSTGDRGRHTAGGRSLMPCRRVGQRTLARTASAATRSRTNDPANIQSKNITGSSFRLFLEPRFPGSGWPTCFLPPMNEGKRGFEGQKFAHTASSPSTIRQVWSRGFPWLNEFLLRQNCKAPASDGFSSVF